MRGRFRRGSRPRVSTQSTSSGDSRTNSDTRRRRPRQPPHHPGSRSECRRSRSVRRSHLPTHPCQCRSARRPRCLHGRERLLQLSVQPSAYRFLSTLNGSADALSRASRRTLTLTRERFSTLLTRGRSTNCRCKPKRMTPSTHRGGKKQNLLAAVIYRRRQFRVFPHPRRARPSPQVKKVESPSRPSSRNVHRAILRPVPRPAFLLTRRTRRFTSPRFRPSHRQIGRACTAIAFR